LARMLTLKKRIVGIAKSHHVVRKSRFFLEELQLWIRKLL